MRIAHFPGSFLPAIGGAEMSIHNIAKHQAFQGNDVYVLVMDKASLCIKERFPNDIPYDILTLFPKTVGFLKFMLEKGINIDFLLQIQLAWLQKKYKFDVWHFNILSYQAIFSVPYLYRKNIPTVITCRGGDIQKMPEINYGCRLDAIFDKYFSKTCNLVDVFTAISNSVKTEYLKLDIKPEKIVNIPNGLEIEKFEQTNCDKLLFKQKYNWPIDKNILITVGRNHPKKGYVFIPEIIQYLKSIREDFVWVIIGRETETVFDKAKELGVEKHLILMGEIGISKKSQPMLSFPTTDLIKAYKAADVFVFPTLLETFGNVQIEAMASGLPVVTTNAPGCCDLVYHEKNGLVSEVKDVRKMAENINRVLSDMELRETIIQNGLEICESYNWSHISKKYISSYEKALLMQSGHVQ
ncbi:MAG: hypothetical protein CMB97_00070 [Flavobacteriaceae bacterium]|nr:hypothetical protein [Flavobacteriaceae bacterium]